MLNTGCVDGCITYSFNVHIMSHIARFNVTTRASFSLRSISSLIAILKTAIPARSMNVTAYMVLNERRSTLNERVSLADDVQDIHENLAALDEMTDLILYEVEPVL